MALFLIAGAPCFQQEIEATASAGIILLETTIRPFTEETGIRVNLVPTPEIAKLKAQLLTGNVDVDLFLTSAEVSAYGSKLGFWEKLNPSNFDLEDMMIPPTSEDVTTNMFVGGIAWDPKNWSPGKHPRNFAEYFDLQKFPGRRTFRSRPNETLELALLADGVTPNAMYPLDVDRAFSMLDRVKPSVAAWVSKPNTDSLRLQRNANQSKQEKKTVDLSLVRDRRLEKIQKYMNEHHIDVALFFKPENSFYVSNFTPLLYSHPLIAILPKKGAPRLLTHAIRDDHARDSSLNDPDNTSL